MMTMDIQEIIKHLPHRFPFLLIDRVIEIDEGKSLTAIKNVSINEPFFRGHFPQMAVMPGVLIIEALAQAGGILVYTQTKEDVGEDNLHFLAGIDNARFKRVVTPGDQLHLKVRFISSRRDFWKIEGIAEVDGQVVCTAEILDARRRIKTDD